MRKMVGGLRLVSAWERATTTKLVPPGQSGTGN
jgi:hypothetical protein